MKLAVGPVYHAAMTQHRSVGPITRGTLRGRPVENAVTFAALRALVTIADLGSFHAAGRHLGYSQSGVSHQVASLERGLGAALFHRPGGRAAVALTPAGHAAYRQARRALAALEALPVDVQEALGPGPAVIRVGVSQTTAAELMPAALAQFHRERPGVEVLLDEAGDTAALFAQLAGGRLDLAFATSPPPDERITALVLADDPFVILTLRNGPLAEVAEPSFDLLDQADLIAWNRRWQIQRELEEALAQRGIVPRIRYRTDDNLALQRLVAAGLGHACVGLLAARRAVDPALTYLVPRESLIPRQLTLCLPRQRTLSGSVQALAACVRTQSGL